MQITYQIVSDNNFNKNFDLLIFSADFLLIYPAFKNIPYIVYTDVMSSEVRIFKQNKGNNLLIESIDLKDEFIKKIRLFCENP